MMIVLDDVLQSGNQRRNEREVLKVAHLDAPMLTTHAEGRMNLHDIDIHSVGATLRFGVGILQDIKEAQLLVGPEVTLVINPERYNIVTVYPNKRKHRFIALRAYVAQQEEVENRLLESITNYCNNSKE